MKKLKPQTVDWAQIERFIASAEKKSLLPIRSSLSTKRLVFNKRTERRVRIERCRQAALPAIHVSCVQMDL